MKMSAEDSLSEKDGSAANLSSDVSQGHMEDAENTENIRESEVTSILINNSFSQSTKLMSNVTDVVAENPKPRNLTESKSGSCSSVISNVTTCQATSARGNIEKIQVKADSSQFNSEPRIMLREKLSSSATTPTSLTPELAIRSGINMRTVIIGADNAISRDDYLYSSPVLNTPADRLQTPRKTESTTAYLINIPKVYSSFNGTSDGISAPKNFGRTYHTHHTKANPNVEILQELTRKRTESYNRVLAQPKLLENATFLQPSKHDNLQKQCVPVFNPRSGLWEIINLENYHNTNEQYHSWNNPVNNRKNNINTLSDGSISRRVVDGGHIPQTIGIRNTSNYRTFTREPSGFREKDWNDIRYQKYDKPSVKQLSPKQSKTGQKRCCC